MFYKVGLKFGEAFALHLKEVSLEYGDYPFRKLNTFLLKVHATWHTALSCDHHQVLGTCVEMWATFHSSLILLGREYTQTHNSTDSWEWAPALTSDHNLRTRTNI